jgi:hypothetical protein
VFGARTILYLTLTVPAVAGNAAAAANTFYISPTGDDANPGTSRDHPWKTFAHALAADGTMRPGHTLVLLDGTYTRGTTGLVRIDCTPRGNARSGTSREPITIRADHEHRAALVSDGTQSSFAMAGCSWWRVEGLRAQNVDNARASQDGGFPFRFENVRDVTVRRLLGSHNNRAHNTHVFAVMNSENVLLEECEAYYFHRHAFSIWKSRHVTLRRCYANSMLYGRRGCCSRIDNRDWGDEAVSLYGTTDSVVENCISENEANGFQIHGIASKLDPSGHGGRNNSVLGSISFEDTIATLVASRADGPDSFHSASGNLFRDFVAARMKGNGLYFRAGSRNRAENVTLFGSTAGSGLAADNGNSGLGGTCSRSLVCTGVGLPCISNATCLTGICARNTEGCSFEATNVLALGNKKYGVTADKNDFLLEYSNATRNGTDYGLKEPIDDDAGMIRHSLSRATKGIGLGTGECLLWSSVDPDMRGAGKQGADIGASVLYRYENGSLTRTPLWDPQTGGFPCGAVVPGINDGPKRCGNVHERLNVDRHGCRFPAGYGG